MGELLKRVAELAFVLALAYVLAGCNAVNGFGRDLQDLSHQYTVRK